MMDSVSQLLRDCGGTVMKFSKLSFDYCSSKFDKQTLKEISDVVAVQCQRVFYEYDKNKRIFIQVVKQKPFVMQLFYSRCAMVPSPRKALVDLSFFHSWHSLACKATLPHDSPVHNLLAAVIWNEFKLVAPTTDELLFKDEKMRKWNQRVNEKELLQKLGPPDRWDIFDNSESSLYDVELWDKFSNKNCVHEPEEGEVETEVCNTDNNHFFINKNKISEDGEKFALNTRVVSDNYESRQRRKHGVFHTIKKMFKNEKNAATRKQNLAKHVDELLREDVLKGQNRERQDDGLLELKSQNTASPTCLSEPPEILPARPLQSISSNVDPDPDLNSLMIHIPNNVQKIVLVKDGRKITIEI